MPINFGQGVGLPLGISGLGFNEDVRDSVGDWLSANDPTRGPAAPNYTGAAEQTGASSRANVNQQTLQNRPDQVGPMGQTLTWETGPDGRPRQVVKYGDQMQSAIDSLMRQFQSGMNTPFSFGSAQDARANAESALFDRFKSRLDPMWDQRQSALNTQLANQGFQMGDAAQSSAMQDFGRSRNDAYQNAMWQSILGGGDEAMKQLQLEQGYRNAPLQSVGALMQLGSGTPQFNQFMGAGVAAPTNYLGAAQLQGQHDMDVFNSKNQLLGSAAQGIGQLGGSLMRLA